MNQGRAIRHVLLAFAALGISARCVHAQSEPQLAPAEAPASAPLAAREVRDAPDDQTEPQDEKRNDNLQIGPIAGIGFPRPLAIGGMVKVQRLVALGVEYSFFPSTTISDVNTSFWAVAGDMRLFPFRNFFFIGLRAGRQHLAADTLLVYADQRYAIAAAVDTLFINPRVGLLWTWSSGVTLGLDAGLQIPVSSRTSGVLASAETFTIPEAMQVIDEVRGVADYLGESTIPTLDLLRIGLLL